jgi:hypothetical protein
MGSADVKLRMVSPEVIRDDKKGQSKAIATKDSKNVSK